MFVRRLPFGHVPILRYNMCTDSISCTYVTANTIACFHSSKCKKYKNNEAPDFYIDSSYPTGHMVMRSTRQRRCAGRGRTPGTARPPPTQTHPRSAQSPAQALCSGAPRPARGRGAAHAPRRIRWFAIYCTYSLIELARTKHASNKARLPVATS